MKKKAVNGPRLLVNIMLLLFFAGMGALPFVLPIEGYRGIGNTLIVVGAIYVLLHKIFARPSKYFKNKSFLGFNLWAYIGRDRTEFLYLGIGVICAAYGVFMVIWSLDVVRLFLSLPIVKSS